MCSEEMRILISGHLDGCNTPKQEAALTEHLAQCPACRRLLNDYKTIDAGIAGLEKAPPASFASSVMRAIEQDAPRAQTPKKRPFRYGTMIAAVAAVLVLAVSAGHIALPKGGSAALNQGAAVADTDAEAPQETHFLTEDSTVLESKAVAEEAEPLPANIDCAALANNEGCYVGLLYAQEEDLPELSDAAKLPLSGGVRYTISQAQLNDLKERFSELQIFAPEGTALNEDANAYLILVTE